MGAFTAVFIGILILGEDGGENGCTIAFRTAREARSLRHGHSATLHTTAKLRLQPANTNPAKQCGLGLR